MIRSNLCRQHKKNNNHSNGVSSKKSHLLKELSNCVKWMSVIDQSNGGFLCHFEGIRTTLQTVYLWWCNTRNLKPANDSITKPLVLRRFPLLYFSLFLYCSCLLIFSWVLSSFNGIAIGFWMLFDTSWYTVGYDVCREPDEEVFSLHFLLLSQSWSNNVDCSWLILCPQSVEEWKISRESKV